MVWYHESDLDMVSLSTLCYHWCPVLCITSSKSVLYFLEDWIYVSADDYKAQIIGVGTVAINDKSEWKFSLQHPSGYKGGSLKSQTANALNHQIVSNATEMPERVEWFTIVAWIIGLDDSVTVQRHIVWRGCANWYLFRYIGYSPIVPYRMKLPQILKWNDCLKNYLVVLLFRGQYVGSDTFAGFIKNINFK